MFTGKPSVNRGKITSTNSTHPTPKPAQQIPIQLNACHQAPLSQSDLVLVSTADLAHDPANVRKPQEETVVILGCLPS
jgi:hypothetical protein